MAHVLYTYPNNYRAHKTLIAAQYAGLDIEVPNFKFPEDCHTPEFLEKHNPNGKVPVLETPHGSLFESNAILRYVARLRSDNTLYGSSTFCRAKIDQWVDWCASELEAARAVWIFPILGILEFDNDAYEGAKKDVETSLAVLDKHLRAHQFMVGNAITIADIAIVSALVYMYTKLFDAEFRSKYPSVNRWFVLCTNQDEFKKVLGTLTFAESETKAAGAGAAPAAKGKGKEKKDAGKGKEAPAPAAAASAADAAPAPAKEKGGKKDAAKKDDKPKDAGKKDGGKAKDGGKKDAGKKDGKDKGGKAKEAAPAKETAAAASEKSNLDLLDELDKPQKKAKNPLDELPESKMNLDATKKLFFAVKPYNPAFWPAFWSNFDAQGFSIWSIKYKYNAENTVYFMTCNLLGGFIQRAEECRKYAFGVVNMYGADENTPPFGLNGAWLFRSTEVIKEMKECPDSEHFDWERIDVSNAVGKALVEKLFVGENVTDNAADKLLERRYFK